MDITVSQFFATPSLTAAQLKSDNDSLTVLENAILDTLSDVKPTPSSVTVTSVTDATSNVRRLLLDLLATSSGLDITYLLHFVNIDPSVNTATLATSIHANVSSALNASVSSGALTTALQNSGSTYLATITGASLPSVNQPAVATVANPTHGPTAAPSTGTPSYAPSKGLTSTKLSAGGIAGIIIGAVAVLVLIGYGAYSYSKASKYNTVLPSN